MIWNSIIKLVQKVCTQWCLYTFPQRRKQNTEAVAETTLIMLLLFCEEVSFLSDKPCKNYSENNLKSWITNAPFDVLNKMMKWIFICLARYVLRTIVCTPHSISVFSVQVLSSTKNISCSIYRYTVKNLFPPLLFQKAQLDGSKC